MDAETYDDITLMSISEDEDQIFWPFSEGPLPGHIIAQIIHYLTMEDIVAASRVCLDWNSFIWNSLHQLDFSTIHPDIFKKYWKSSISNLLNRPRRLTHLRMNVAITDEGLSVLSSIDSVDTLDLRGCSNITQKGLKNLIRPKPKFPYLQYLNLSDCNGINDEALEYLLPYSNLGQLYLANSGVINGSGLNYIAQLKQIWRLDLQGLNKLREQNVYKLVELPYLRVLELAGCNSLSPICVESLRTKLHKVEVLTWREEQHEPESKAKKRRLKLGLAINIKREKYRRKQKANHDKKKAKNDKKVKEKIKTTKQVTTSELPIDDILRKDEITPIRTRSKSQVVSNNERDLLLNWVNQVPVTARAANPEAASMLADLGKKQHHITTPSLKKNVSPKRKRPDSQHNINEKELKNMPLINIEKNENNLSGCSSSPLSRRQKPSPRSKEIAKAPLRKLMKKMPLEEPTVSEDSESDEVPIIIQNTNDDIKEKNQEPEIEDLKKLVISLDEPLLTPITSRSSTAPTPCTNSPSKVKSLLQNFESQGLKQIDSKPSNTGRLACRNTLSISERRAFFESITPRAEPKTVRRSSKIQQRMSLFEKS